MYKSRDAARTLRVVSTPSVDLALTNCAFCSRGEFALFKLPRADYGHGCVNGQLVFKILYPFIANYFFAAIA
jgi:hypothetical protein